MTSVLRIVRTITALALAGMCATAPLVFDECAASCEALQSGAAAGSTPSCHKSADSTRHVGHPSIVCSHDENGVLSATAFRKASSDRSHLFVVVTFNQPALDLPAGERFSHPSASPPPLSGLAAPARPLRV